MQDSQADIAKGCRVGTEEKNIRFRPSPNFKNMKKFLKSKIDFTENSNHSPVHGAEVSPTNTSPEPITSLEEQRALLEKVQPTQPPLPIEPPPTTPIDFSLPHKQEIEDHGYESRLGSPTLNHREENSHTNYETSQTTEPSDKPTKTICRDFIRGTCTRAGCKYAHERDLSQLFGVYTFCRNFQNSVCTYPYCKYVHASIFEEQRFYRTGELPPHALAHHKKTPPVVLPPPPPPPPEEPVPPPAIESVPIFLNPPPVLVPSVNKPIISCVPTANLESRPLDHFIKAPPEVQNASALSPCQSNSKLLISCVPVSKLESKPAENDIRNMLQAIASPLKRAWNTIDPFSTSPRDIHHKELYTKKCKHCDNMEIRLQRNKKKLESMESSTKVLQLKTQLLSKKSQALSTVLITVIKEEAATLSGIDKLTAKLSHCGEEQREVLHQILENNRMHFSNMM